MPTLPLHRHLADGPDHRVPFIPDGFSFGGWPTFTVKVGQPPTLSQAIKILQTQPGKLLIMRGDFPLVTVYGVQLCRVN